MTTIEYIAELGGALLIVFVVAAGVASVGGGMRNFFWATVSIVYLILTEWGAPRDPDSPLAKYEAEVEAEAKARAAALRATRT